MARAPALFSDWTPPPSGEYRTDIGVSRHATGRDLSPTFTYDRASLVLRASVVVPGEPARYDFEG